MTVIMTMTQEKVTVAIACKMLGISQRSLYRLLKDGRLTRIKEGHRTYILTSELHDIRHDMSQSRAQKKTATVTSNMTLSRDRYESILQELGELRERNKLLLEHKVTKDHEVNELQKEVTELKARLKDENKPFFKKIIGMLK